VRIAAHSDALDAGFFADVREVKVELDKRRAYPVSDASHTPTSASEHTSSILDRFSVGFSTGAWCSSSHIAGFLPLSVVLTTPRHLSPQISHRKMGSLSPSSPQPTFDGDCLKGIGAPPGADMRPAHPLLKRSSRPK
jgi:hypothetical protein